MLSTRIAFRACQADAARLRDLSAKLPELPTSAVARLALRAGLRAVERDPAGALLAQANPTPPPRPAA